VPATAVSCSACKRATAPATEPARPTVWLGDSGGVGPRHYGTLATPARAS
jgi:hypothetical protein